MTTETTEQSQEQQVDPAVLARATKMGWVSKEQFRGDVSKWTDAETYVERGETVLPILRANNQRLENELGQTKGQVAALTQVVSAQTESIEALKEFNSAENLARVKAQKQQILAGIKQAKKDEDVDQEVELTDQLQQTNAAIKEAETKPLKKEPPATQQQQQQLSPEFVEWNRDNTWFGKDIRKTAYANGVAQELQAGGSSLKGRAFLDHVAAETEKFFNQGEPASSRVADSRNGGSNGGSSNGSQKAIKSFSALPEDAQQACMRQASRLVGPKGSGRAYESVEAWQAAYVKQYNLL